MPEFIHPRKVIYYLIWGFLLITVVLVLLFLVPAGVGEISLIPAGLESYLLTQRYANSNSCFAFHDEKIARTYPSIIDPEKFTKENLDSCYDTQDTKIKAYRLTLKYDKISKTISTKNWEDIASKSQIESVLINDNNKIKRGSLLIELQNAQ